MAIKALNLHMTKEISHPDDSDDPTIWIIGAVDSRTFGHLSDKSLVVGVDANNPDGDADVKLARNNLAFEVVQAGLKGWKNFLDEKGDVPFKTERKTIGSRVYEVVSGDTLSRIPGNVLRWLADEIMTMNSLGADEGKP
jgi:hypothetical protein